MGWGVRGVVLSWLIVGLSAGAGAEPASTAAQPSRSPVRDLAVSDIVIAPDLGYVLETQPPAASKPILIYIQEAHAHPEAQQHILTILEQLTERQHLDLILVEGGAGDVSLARLRRYGSPEVRKAVAKKYFDAGLLHPEGYLDMTSDRPLILWGVEDEPLYQQQFDAFQRVEPLRQAFQPVLAEVRAALELLIPRAADPSLGELDAKRRDYEAGTLGLAPYARFLSSQAERQGLDLHAWPQVERLLALRRQEEDLQPELIQQEQRALVGRLSSAAKPQELQALVTAGLGLAPSAGEDAATEEFYTRLERLAREADIPLAAYPNLSHYLDGLRQRRAIDVPVLSGELEQLVGRLRAGCFSGPQAAALHQVDEEVRLVDQLLAQALTPEEYQRLRAAGLAGLSGRWSRAIRDAWQGSTPIPAALERLPELEAALPAAQRFYELSLARDEAIIRNTLAKLREARTPLAVLITGGFHAPEVITKLKAEGIGLVVVAPKVSRAADEARYRAVLRAKNGGGNLDEVFALPQTTTGGDSR